MILMPEEQDATPELTATCGVTMGWLKPCGRTIHSAMAYDANPVCLMHSRDPEKNDAEFHAEIERILAEAEQTESTADFQKIVFPALDYPGRVFAPACDYSFAMFTRKAHFNRATFARRAGFHSAIFTLNADFGAAAFNLAADFSAAKFSSDAYFVETTFAQDANFVEAQFCQDVEFDYATFNKVASFYQAKFSQDTSFRLANFSENANFDHATFSQVAYFRRAKFTQGTYFRSATFLRGVDFFRASISGGMHFQETIFRHDFETDPGLDFSELKIKHPERVEFYKTNLRQALFFNTDVSKFDFTLVQWRRRGRSSRLCLCEETVNLKKAEALKPLEESPDERNYQLIAETYQQLKRNYDAKGDYWTAGHWHYGEMEMQRLHSNWKPRWARWLSHHLSLVALYKYTSAYGESYTLPLLWLAAVIAAFALIYPATGLEIHLHDQDKILAYGNYTDFFRVNPNEHPQGLLGVHLHGAMASLSVAGFQRELRYAPSYPCGRLFALIELLLTTTLGALFALAIRRQFKRS